MDKYKLIEEINKYNNIDRDTFFINKVKERLNKSFKAYNSELSLIINSYKYSMKELKQINKQWKT